MKPSAISAARAVQGCNSGESPRTQLLAQTYNISVLADKGVKGMWPTKPLLVLQAAKQIAGEGGNATALLRQTVDVSRKIDDGIKGIWPTNVLQLLQKADQVAGA
jgi:hypothetical protein